MRPTTLLAAAPLLCAACGGGGGGAGQPVWRSLAAGFEPAERRIEKGPWSAAPELELSASPDGAGWWVGETLAASDWTSTGKAGLWSTPVSMPGAGRPRDGTPERELAAGERAFTWLGAPSPAELADPARAAPGSFTVHGEILYLLLAPGETPPETVHLRTFLDRGAPADGRWRLTVGRTTGDGIPLLPGHAEELVVDLPPRSVLRFATASSSFAGPPSSASPPPRIAFRVDLDGARVFEHLAASAPGDAPAWHAVELPEEGRRAARLTFSLEGPPAVAAFLCPALGPRDAGGYGARPFGSPRPDLLLFLADTFRADNLGLYGGTLGLTPVLDGFAAEALCFERAWSPASWTLPAQASLLTGLSPHQHAARQRDERLPRELTTVAERLRDAGYRTGAVTEGGFVSQTFGLDQGFEYFAERLASLEDEDGPLAVARAFLDADDGRPVFLFLQTYRTHTPYRVSEETQRAHGARLALAEPYEVVDARLQVHKRGWSQGDPVSAELRAAVADYRDLYRGAAADLDRGFGAFLGDLAVRGLDRSAVVVFTSDHGEAFFEHDTLGHGVGVHEEVVRIPLLLRGPGIAPGRISYAATLVDLPYTLAKLADTAPAPAWGGRALVGLDAERPAFAFECRMIEGKQSTLALIEGQRKVIAEDARNALERGELLRAYDLEHDPREAADVLAGGAVWPAELFARVRSELFLVLEPLAAVERAEVGGAQVHDLQKLGY